MSTTTEVLGAIKKVFLLSDDMTRVTAELKDLTRQVSDHEGRLIRLETVLAAATQTRRIILPGE